MQCCGTRFIACSRPIAVTSTVHTRTSPIPNSIKIGNSMPPVTGTVFQSFDSDNTTNSLVQDRTHNSANEITNITDIVGPQSSPIAHDRNGNMTILARSVSEGSLTLTWDAWNRLVQIDDATSTVAGYQYDGLNRRIVKTVSGSDTHFFYSTEWQVLQETSYQSTPFPSVDRSYIWGIRYIDDLVMQATGTRYYALQDANWNVTALSNTTGDSNRRYQYSPYGTLQILTPTWTSRATSSYNNPYTYTGRRIDQESKLYYYRNRYYDNNVGRFINRDALRYVDGMSVYRAYFVPNSVDPSGEERCSNQQCRDRCQMGDVAIRPFCLRRCTQAANRVINWLVLQARQGNPGAGGIFAGLPNCPCSIACRPCNSSRWFGMRLTDRGLCIPPGWNLIPPIAYPSYLDRYHPGAVWDFAIGRWTSTNSMHIRRIWQLDYAWSQESELSIRK